MLCVCGGGINTFNTALTRHRRFVGTHTAQYAYNSDRSCMRNLSLHTAPTRAVCGSDHRIQLLVAVCVSMVYMIFSVSSKGTHTAPNEIFKSTSSQFMSSIYYASCCVHKSFRTHVIIPRHTTYSFRLFNYHICMCLYIFVLAHLSQRLICFFFFFFFF